MRNEGILIHFVCMYCIWFNHVNLQSNIIPRNLTSLTISSICVPIFKTNLPNLSYVNVFLSNRTLQVRINNTCSDIYIVQNGTPQGSCISPTLFNIMVNELGTCK
jgi:hypothetical protein